MGFRAYLGVAADQSQPLDRRSTHLVNAVKRFPLLGFHQTFAQLHFVTGSTVRNWTPAQIDVAVEMMQHAYESWSTVREKAERARRNAEGQPRYNARDAFESWKAEYFGAERSAIWRLDAMAPISIEESSAAKISLRVVAWLRNLRR